MSPSRCCCPRRGWDRDGHGGGFWLWGWQWGAEAGGLVLPLWGGSDRGTGVLNDPNPVLALGCTRGASMDPGPHPRCPDPLQCGGC